MKVLVCGDRDWTDSYAVARELEGLKTEHADLEIIEGCARGADSMAEDWADSYSVPVHHFPAQWETYGKAAGPIRNIKMLAERPDLVIAFHADLAKSKGTRHMVTIARQAKVPVKVYIE